MRRSGEAPDAYHSPTKSDFFVKKMAAAPQAVPDESIMSIRVVNGIRGFIPSTAHGRQYSIMLKQNPKLISVIRHRQAHTISQERFLNSMLQC